MKTREIKPKMEFNPGVQKYEPVLPLRKVKDKIKFDLVGLIVSIIGLLILLGILLWALQNRLI